MRQYRVIKETNNRYLELINIFSEFSVTSDEKYNLLKYELEYLYLEHFHFRQLFILPFFFILDANIVLFTALHLFNYFRGIIIYHCYNYIHLFLNYFIFNQTENTD